MKRRLCAATAVMLCLSFLFLSACANRSGVQVNGTPIDKGIVLYFTDEARREQPDADDAVLLEAANRKIAEYVAVNSVFADRMLALTTAEKSEVSQTVNALWRLFGNYYTELGVSKQDLQKIETAKAYKDAVMADYYAPDGDEPVAEETLKSYFNENYIAFKSITGFLTTADNSGNAVSLTDAEKTALVSSFEKMAANINGGSSVEEQASKADNTTANTDTVVISRANTNYPSDFFGQVAAIENGSAKAFTTGDYIFVVQREDITDAERNLFATYRTDCLKTLKGEAFEQVLDAWVSAYTVER